MLPFASTMMMGASRLIPSTNIASGQRGLVGDSSIISTAVANVGDIAFALIQSSAVVSGGSGAWSYSPALGNYMLASKLLSAADIAGILTVSEYPFIWAIYRTPVGYLRRTYATGENTLVVTGFTKSFLSTGFIGWAAGSSSTSAAPTMPPGWATRQTVTGGGGLPRLCFGDLLTPASYTNGATISFGAPAQVGQTVAVVEELLNA